MTMLSVDVVKRAKRKPAEPFQSDKLKRSIYLACLGVRTPDGHAENTSGAVTDAVIIWVKTKPTVTSADIRRIAATHLEKYQPDAAYLYLNHHVII